MLEAVQTNLILIVILFTAFLWAYHQAAIAAPIRHQPARPAPVRKMKRESDPQVRVILVGRKW